MKTKWILIPVIALSLGCTREIDTNVTYVDGEFTLYATSGENETRTVLQQDGSVFWSPSDCITVFYGNIPGKFTSTNTEPAASSEFTGSLGSFILDGETEFKAIYPHSDEIVMPTDEGILSIGLPWEQTAVEGTFSDDLFICVAKSKDTHLHFYNVCGGVKISLNRDDIKKVVFKGNNNETLAGRMAVQFDSDGIPQVTRTTGGHSSVALTAPGGGTFKKGSWYYLVLIPQTLSRGYTMELWTDELAETVSSESSVTVRRSAWGVLKELGNHETPPTSIPDAVDLGLPSGLKWASFNVGATKPEEYGDYFAWGETEPYYSSQNPLTWKAGKETGYFWPSYRLCMGDIDTMTKYCDDSAFGFNGFTDKINLLDPEDDVAHVNLGGIWRMPTEEEWTELMNNCTWTWTSQNKVNGRLVTARNGNSIFLPAAGYRTGTYLEDLASSGDYWSSSLYSGRPILARHMDFSSSNVDMLNDVRMFGFSIRPVYGEVGHHVPVESVTLDKSEIELSIGGTSTLTATILPDNATNKSVTWTSSDASIATVSSEGTVTGIAAGSAIITVTTADGGKTATCNVTVQKASSPVEVPDAVDLGLPSGLKWASFNLGATKPEEYGDYYAWGETGPKTVYDIGSYKFSKGEWKTLTKYCTNVEDGYNGFVDGKTTLDLEDDVAHVKLGGNWRMPTLAEWLELQENCTYSWIRVNGIPGRKYISKYNGNSIFIPTSGIWNDNRVTGKNSGAYLWSSSLNPDESDYAFCTFFSEYYNSNNKYMRSSGQTIRPVYEVAFVSVESVSLDKESMNLSVGETSTLVAVILPENATNKRVIWSSNDESIAMVSSEGVVTAVAAGSAIIIVTTVDGGKTATCNVTVQKASPPAVPDAVDLGLPSGLLWGSFNLGATKPAESGDYYAWGETEPYYNSLTTLIWKPGKESGYTWSSYRWCMGLKKSLTKYCFDSSYGYNGFTDSKTVLDPEDDAAAVNLGDKWRMPTMAEFEELYLEGVWKSTSVDGVSGLKITGPNGNSIFLPSAQHFSDKDLLIKGVGYYWTSSLSTDTPELVKYLYATAGYEQFYNLSRCDGLSIRPIYGDRIIHVNSISLDKKVIEMSVGKTATLVATVIPEIATNKDVIWSSGDASVATVSSEGVVTGVGLGSTTIVVTTVDGGKTASCNVTIKNFSASLPVPQAIDLGLSVKWASFNLGASKPEESGNFYAWGEIEPKETYSWGTYKWCNGTENSINKYTEYVEDNDYNLEPGDDAAHVHLGEEWRIPSMKELRELKNNCIWTWTTQDGVNGYKVSSKVNENSIFLPAAGIHYKTSLLSPGDIGALWSSSYDYEDPPYAGSLSFSSRLDWSYMERFYGFSIRPVYLE